MVRFARMGGMYKGIDNSQRARIARMQETLKEFMGQLGHAGDDLRGCRKDRKNVWFVMTVGRRGGHAGNTERIVGCYYDWTVRVARTPEALREMWVVMGRGGGENAGNIDGKNVWDVTERRVAGMRGIKFVCDDCRMRE